MGLRRAARLTAVVCLAAAWPQGDAAAGVLVTDPDDPTPFFRLFRPTGQFDEPGLSGFEFLISSRTNEFRENDQYLIAGEETAETTSIGNDLGGVAELSGTSFDFSIEHHLVGGRNFTFRLTDSTTGIGETLCWGRNCPPGSNATELLDGQRPIRDYNGIQIQVRAQEIAGSSAAVTIASLTGVSVSGADFFDEIVTPTSPGTISPLDAGRRGQWLLADSLDLVLNEWALSGTVVLTRPDDALTDVTKVRLAVDLVRDITLPALPEPSVGGLLATGLVGLAMRRRRLLPRARPPQTGTSPWRPRGRRIGACGASPPSRRCAS